jgi:hypothetical protein
VVEEGKVELAPAKRTPLSRVIKLRTEDEDGEDTVEGLAKDIFEILKARRRNW